MAESNIVAIVGVGAGALVALAAPAITVRAHNRGQGRLFAHEKSLADRRELREVLDDTSEAIAEVERTLGRLHLVYVAAEDVTACEPALARAGEAIRSLELLCARVAIRLGGEHPVYQACEEISSRGEAIVSGLARYLTLPDLGPVPSSRAIEVDIKQIRSATSSFITRARDLVGSQVFETAEAAR